MAESKPAPKGEQKAKFVPKAGSGFLFRNGYKSSDRSPNAVGQLTLPDGTVMRLAAWTRVDKNGQRYQTLQLSHPEAGRAPTRGATAPTARSSEIVAQTGSLSATEALAAKEALRIVAEEEKVANITRKHSDAMGAVPNTDYRVASKERATDEREGVTEHREVDCTLCHSAIGQGDAQGWWDEEPAHQCCVDGMTSGWGPDDAPSA